MSSSGFPQALQPKVTERVRFLLVRALSFTHFAEGQRPQGFRNFGSSGHLPKQGGFLCMLWGFVVVIGEPGKTMFNPFRLFVSTLPLRTIWGLVWPQTMMMLCILLIGLTDMWVAGKISVDAQAAVGLASQLQAFFMVLAFSLGSGAMATVSQSIGAKRKKRGQYYASLVMLLAVGLALFLVVAGLLGIDLVLMALQVPLDLQAVTSYVFSVVLCSLPAQYIMNVGGTLFRATRNVFVPLLVMGAACVINMFGDLAFGLGYFGMPALGVMGIAWSTLASVCMAALLTLYFLYRCQVISPRLLPSKRWMRAATPYLIKVVGPALFTQFMWQLGYLTLFGVVASLPQSNIALAGMAAGMRVEAILFMPAMAFNVTAAVMVGNALGAGDVRLAKSVGLANVVFGVFSMSLLAVGMWFIIPQLAAEFSESVDVQAQIAMYLVYNVLSTPFTVGGMILNGVMTGAGATFYILVINTTGIWLVRLPLAWYLSHVVWNSSEGIFAAMLLSMAAQASCMLWVFFKKDWMRYSMRASLHKIPSVRNVT